MTLRAAASKLGPLVGLALVFGFFFISVWVRTGHNNFATRENLQTIALQSSIVGMATLGMTLIIISGGIDLSTGSVVALSSVGVAALLRIRGWSAFPAAFGGVSIGGLCGLLNGILITQGKVVPFIITLGTSLILRGVAKEIANNGTITPSASALDALLDQSDILPTGAWMLALLALAVSGILHYTRFGRHVFAIGSNEQAARLCGVPISRTKLLVYTAAGVSSGLAGLLQYSRLTIGDPTSALGLELDVIASVVIGGASLSGGEGSIVGSLIGALFMTTIRNGCSLMGWPNNWTEIVAGTIIIVAAGVDRLRHRGAA
jgi:ribose transport system permease protein